MTYVSDGIQELRGRRHGVCHRCGWPGMVGVVRRRDRRILKTGHRFGRLCQECVNDIIRAQPVFQSTHSVAAVKAGRTTAKAGRIRQVA
jgi:hypothetical protein